MVTDKKCVAKVEISLLSFNLIKISKKSSLKQIFIFPNYFYFFMIYSIGFKYYILNCCLHYIWLTP